MSEYLLVYRKNEGKNADHYIYQYPAEVREASRVKPNKEYRENVWYMAQATNEHHPAVFPAALASLVVSRYSMRGDLVMDCFAGSGTVGVAALAGSRKFFLTESVPKYAELIQRRIGFECRSLTQERFLQKMRWHYRGAKGTAWELSATQSGQTEQNSAHGRDVR